jgi:predicted Ser/Thr protein kinase
MALPQNSSISLHTSALDPKALDLGETISEGNFGVVYKGKYLDKPVAIKQFKGQQQQSEFENEIKLIS